MPSWFPYAMALVGMIYHAASPALKAQALVELKALADKEKAAPWLVMLIGELESMVQALPETLPGT